MKPIPRMSRHQMFMEVAGVIAKRSTCYRANVGCVITLRNRIISTGYNGPPKNEPHCQGDKCEKTKRGTCSRAIHAERNAIEFIRDAYFSHDSIFKQAVLYCEFSPCFKCANLILDVGIKTIVYNHPYDKAVLIKLKRQPGLNIYRCTSAGYLFDEKTETLVDNI